MLETLALALVTLNTHAALQGIQTEDLNREVQACTDFYEFANGTWRAHNPVPASLPR